MISIKEIAELTGVSPTTVANVLHGRNKKVSEEKRKRVQEMLDKTNYISCGRARSVGKQGSRIIAIILSYKQSENASIVQDPFASSLIAVMEEAAQKAGYYIILYANTNIEACFHMALVLHIDGIIFLGANRDNFYEFQSKLRLPIATIDTYFKPTDQRFLNIGLEDKEGGYQMMQYLVEKGHQKIIFLGMDLKRHKMKIELKNPFEKSYIEEILSRFGEIDQIRYQGCEQKIGDMPGYELSAILLDSNPKEREAQIDLLVAEKFFGATALFFSADYLAIESINLFYDRGIRVPEDISVVGFDDTLSAIQIRPKLTTVHQDIASKGKIAMEEIIKTIEGKKDRTINIKLPIEIMERDSVKNIEL